MPTYVYQTLPVDTAQPPRRFEVKQSMKDAALTHDPETGLPVRRVLGANINFLAADNTGAAVSSPGSSGASCGTGCGCH
jgi:predicted nucleic acid-binding Zn ribbon protein